MPEELKAKLQQFLAEEIELLEDYAMDVDDSEDADLRTKGRALALWTIQSTRVNAIRDAMELLGISEL